MKNKYQEKKCNFHAEAVLVKNNKEKESFSEHDFDIFGFIINGEIQFDIKKKRLVNIISSDYENGVALKIITLNNTITKLLVFLLYRSQQAVIYKDDISSEVWGEDILNDNKRLWQTMKELRRKLELMGISQDFITSIRGQGYSLSNKNICPLLYKKEDTLVT